MSGLNNTKRAESFVVLLTGAQCDLQTYIAYLVGNPDDAQDILQDTNLVLWREASRYDAKRPFLAWAKTVAYYQVLTFFKKRSRDRLVFDQDMVLLLAEADSGHHTGMQERLLLLDACFKKLTQMQRAVMKWRYYRDWPVRRIAKKFECSEASISMLLTRTRRALAECIERSLADKREAGA
ncbi:MAG: sigma-70 family RNA polymerase sigma factor [Kiritimatiellae bacterium]|nr:sigma-70 family RNA polymerase sigma factor [Kiritimatiellia bacterium]